MGLSVERGHWKSNKKLTSCCPCSGQAKNLPCSTPDALTVHFVTAKWMKSLLPRGWTPWESSQQGIKTHSVSIQNQLLLWREGGVIEEELNIGFFCFKSQRSDQSHPNKRPADFSSIYIRLHSHSAELQEDYVPQKQALTPLPKRKKTLGVQELQRKSFLF